MTESASRQTSRRSEDAPDAQPELWLDLYGDVLFRDALVRLGDRAAAADAVQETFLAALRGRDARDSRPRDDFRAWLRAILRNKVVDQIRRRARERPFDTSDPEGVSEHLLFKLTGVPTRTPEDWAFDVETAFEREEFWAAFETCLASLGDTPRAVFTLKTLDGVSTEEICNILGISANNVAVVLHRARRALQRCLESKWFVED